MRSCWSVVSGLVAVLVLFVPSSFGADKPTQTITGVVKAADVYKGKVQSVYIKDPAQGSFLVIRTTPTGKTLIKQVGTTVKATGYVRKSRPDSDFERVIDVLSYEIVSTESPGAAPVQPLELPPEG